MLSQELQLMSRMSRVTSYDQSRLTKQDLLPDTNWTQSRGTGHRLV